MYIFIVLRYGPDQVIAFFGPAWGYRGSFQTQGMLKRSIINKRIW